ncbi:hypothetical protein FE391_40950 [Nonomuraea sp. KC401]|uniref:hypothetical protein n=1 Tax=unclassified Nonomuraea TaxID=2593643 RepID=UPI0010FD4138|nr:MULTISPECIES: hypothetical protein [unclassified Nonomuraea]NBE99933.1 hypothetical protein [Nonomuraea sp. K271]TLF55094.1 hypothetical protein FE391_40950 [Nonomuraea sp. KC401]
MVAEPLADRGPVPHARAGRPGGIEGRLAGTAEAVDDRTCLLTMRGDDLHLIAVAVACLELGFDVLEPVELKERLHALGRRLLSSRI